MKAPEFKRRLRRNFIAFPKMMHRIGLLPKLWEAERRAERYANAAHAAAYFQEWGKAKRRDRKLEDAR